MGTSQSVQVSDNLRYPSISPSPLGSAIIVHQTARTDKARVHCNRTQVTDSILHRGSSDQSLILESVGREKHPQQLLQEEKGHRYHHGQSHLCRKGLIESPKVQHNDIIAGKCQNSIQSVSTLTATHRSKVPNNTDVNKDGSNAFHQGFDKNMKVVILEVTKDDCNTCRNGIDTLCKLNPPDINISGKSRSIIVSPGNGEPGTDQISMSTAESSLQELTEADQATRSLPYEVQYDVDENNEGSLLGKGCSFGPNLDSSENFRPTKTVVECSYGGDNIQDDNPAFDGPSYGHNWGYNSTETYSKHEDEMALDGMFNSAELTTGAFIPNTSLEFDTDELHNMDVLQEVDNPCGLIEITRHSVFMDLKTRKCYAKVYGSVEGEEYPMYSDMAKTSRSFSYGPDCSDILVNLRPNFKRTSSISEVSREGHAINILSDNNVTTYSASFKGKDHVFVPGSYIRHRCSSVVEFDEDTITEDSSGDEDILDEASGQSFEDQNNYSDTDQLSQTHPGTSGIIIQSQILSETYVSLIDSHNLVDSGLVSSVARCETACQLDGSRVQLEADENNDTNPQLKYAHKRFQLQAAARKSASFQDNQSFSESCLRHAHDATTASNYLCVEKLGRYKLSRGIQQTKLYSNDVRPIPRHSITDQETNEIGSTYCLGCDKLSMSTEDCTAHVKKEKEGSVSQMLRKPVLCCCQIDNAQPGIQIAESLTSGDNVGNRRSEIKSCSCGSQREISSDRENIHSVSRSGGCSRQLTGNTGVHENHTSSTVQETEAQKGKMKSATDRRLGEDEKQDDANGQGKKNPAKKPTFIDRHRNYIQNYAAYLCCDDENMSSFGRPFHYMLEQWGLPICIALRDLTLTGPKFENMATCVQDRCNGKIIVILSNTYANSEECLFLTYFAKHLDPDSKKKNIIPVVIDKDVEIPSVLRGMCFIKYNFLFRNGWLKRKLVSAIAA